MSNPFIGSWTYRSMLNDPDLYLDSEGNPDFNKVVFGYGTLALEEAGAGELGGTIGGDGWSLALHGSMAYGSPGEVRFQGKGVVGGNQWIYDYVGWLVPVWPNSDPGLQRPTIVGSIVRAIPHPSSGGGVSPAGVVASWYATRQD
jgi:hypothetical protein